MPVQTYRERTVNGVQGPVIHTGNYASRAAGVVFCAANGIALPYVHLVGDVLDDCDLSGLQAPGADLRGASCRRIIANKLVNGLPLNLAAAQLQGCLLGNAPLTHVDLSCTHPTAFRRVQLGALARLRGVDWADCPNVLVLPVRDDQVGRAVVFYDGVNVQVHAGERGVLNEAAAQTTLEALPNGTQAQRYRDAFAWLASSAGAAARAAAFAVALVVFDGAVVTHNGEPVYAEEAP